MDMIKAVQTLSVLKGGELRVAELAKQLKIGKNTAFYRIYKLAQMGLVEVTSDYRVRITEKGLKLIEVLEVVK